MNCQSQPVQVNTIVDWNIQIVSIQGKVATQKLVNGIQNIPVLSGTWMVHGIGPQGQTLNKFVNISREGSQAAMTRAP